MLSKQPNTKLNEMIPNRVVILASGQSIQNDDE